MAENLALEGLTRRDLIELSQKLAQLASEATSPEETMRPKWSGSPRDPAVRKLARFALHDLKDVKKFSYEEIGNLIEISRERVHQLYKELVQPDATAE
jgi:hypothetical protein